MRHIKGDSVVPKVVTSIEGTATSGVFNVRPLLNGDNICLLEVRVERGAASRMHAHAHESLVYVLSGRLRTVVLDKVLELGAGEACRHPENVPHSVEALEDTVYLEMKSPAPDLQVVFGA